VATSIAKRVQGLLDVPDSFRKTALGFPDKAEQAIALIDTPEAAKDLLDRAQALEVYARRVKLDTEALNAIQYGKLLITAKLGELLPAGGPSERGTKGGRGKKAPNVPLPAFSGPAISRYRRVSAHQPKLREYREEIELHNAGTDDPHEMSTADFLKYVGAGGVLCTKHNNDIVEWYTPAHWIESVRKVMGTIDLDPATSTHAQQVVKADRFYTKDSDGLSKDWQGTVFLNPPFKASLVSAFVHKLCVSYTENDVTQAVLLTNNNTDTEWWHEAAELSAAVAFTNGRVSFYNQAGAWSSPTNGQSFFYFGKKMKQFCIEFSKRDCILMQRIDE